MTRVKPIWEQYGITLEEYAKAFVEAMDKIFIKTKIGKFPVVIVEGFPYKDLFLVVDEERCIKRICNIG